MILTTKYDLEEEEKRSWPRRLILIFLTFQQPLGTTDGKEKINNS